MTKKSYGIKYDSRVYIQWEKKYKQDPIKTRKELYAINRYHKVYLHILSLTHHKGLIKDIYAIMIDKFQTDLYKANKGERISALAKWLPREGNSFDRQLNFIEKFTEQIYPNMKKSEAFKQYRKNIVYLTKKLNVTENLLTQSDPKNGIETIDFTDVPVVCMRQNMHRFLKNDVCKEKLQKYLHDKFTNVSPKTYINYLTSDTVHPVERRICINALSVRKYKLVNDHKFLKHIIGKNLTLVMDTSKETFEDDSIYSMIIVALITLQHSRSVVINSTSDPVVLDIDQRKNICEKADILLENIVSSQSIDLDKISATTDKNLLILSNKPITGKYRDDRNIYVWKGKYIPHIPNTTILSTTNIMIFAVSLFVAYFIKMFIY